MAAGFFKLSMVNQGFDNREKIYNLKNYILDKISIQMSLYYTQIEENSNVVKVGFFFFTFSWFFSITLRKSRFSILAIIMAKIEDFDFIKEILKNQLKVRKNISQNVANIFKLSII